jgi:hypothetical protein
MIEVEAFGTFIRIFSLLKSESLSADIKLTLQKAAWEFHYMYMYKILIVYSKT